MPRSIGQFTGRLLMNYLPNRRARASRGLPLGMLECCFLDRLSVCRGEFGDLGILHIGKTFEHVCEVSSYPGTVVHSIAARRLRLLPANHHRRPCPCPCPCPCRRRPCPCRHRPRPEVQNT